MKRLLLLLGLLVFATSCSDKKEDPNSENLLQEEILEEGKQITVRPDLDITFGEETYTYKIGENKIACNKKDKVACAIDLYVKCTLNPQDASCDKKKMPKFVFMNDESLQRPTEMSFKIVKIKPIDADVIEVYTESTCNGMWFGLCEGSIIYVLKAKNDQWIVKDVYAFENF